MHYYIDGYNLLFRVSASEESLQKQRATLLSYLSDKAIQLKLSFTVVFDAPKQPEGILRGHFGPLEVVYTASGESADEYILSALNYLQKGQSVIVVTSDRELMHRAKDKGAQGISVETFLASLKRPSRQQKKAPPLRTTPMPSSPQPVLDESASRYLALFETHQGESVFETDFERWLRIFEKRLADNDQCIT